MMFQDFGAKAFALEQPPHRSGRFEEASELLSRYPHLAEIELARLINLYRGFSAADMALIMSNDRLAPMLDRFSRDHRSKLRTPFRQYAALVAYAVLTIGAVVWAAAFAS